MKNASRAVLGAVLAGVAAAWASGGAAAAVTAPANDLILGPPAPPAAVEPGHAGVADPAPAADPFGVTRAGSGDAFRLTLDRDDLVVGSRVFNRVSNPSAGQGPTENPVYLAADAGEPEKPNIHGFLSVPFKSAYVTPRGLVVENQGLVIQPVGGFVFPLGDLGPVKNFTFVTGVWNSINTHQDDTNVGPWNEMDYFAAFSGNVGPVSLTLTYGAWNFPQSTEAKPSTEHNIDLKIEYDDSKMWGDSGFALKPYVDLWWAVAGSSTVVLGRQGDTGYVEIGIIPTFTVKSIPNYPLKFFFPTYFSVGPENYWGEANPDGHFGVFSTSANVTVPLSFIPGRYGSWSATAGVSYFYLINDNLLEAGRILSGNSDRNVLVGSIGIGVNF
ncbi:MAG TPA: hypothetical protein VF796_09925 [Humisphaera sp.]